MAGVLVEGLSFPTADAVRAKRSETSKLAYARHLKGRESRAVRLEDAAGLECVKAVDSCVAQVIANPEKIFDALQERVVIEIVRILTWLDEGRENERPDD